MLAVAFFFCGRRFSGTCCSLLMLLDELITVSLRLAWNLNQNWTFFFFSEWVWNKFCSSYAHPTTKLSWQMTKMNCRYLLLTSLLICPVLEPNTLLLHQKCHFSTTELLFLRLVYLQKIKTCTFSQMANLQLPNKCFLSLCFSQTHV